jgi:hypothetical protein
LADCWVAMKGECLADAMDCHSADVMVEHWAASKALRRAALMAWQQVDCWAGSSVAHWAAWTVV